jgi:hypothetical protein
VKQNIIVDIIISVDSVIGLISCWSDSFALKWIFVKPTVFHRVESTTYRIELVLK